MICTVRNQKFKHGAGLFTITLENEDELILTVQEMNEVWEGVYVEVESLLRDIYGAVFDDVTREHIGWERIDGKLLN